ncbi:hypothetical protein CYLTODRAFT_459847 [Cylindrobasidium torrendii FP15055 ss-10]|uniref:Uncharacterized protein n=1 Tax=Cylindrobasidium torrendii FP15055 ss-10 TaxID=1314674 RepID=A0A0D7ATB3_9AGAR|nr:hypothetical protein CYLTODRAFT_459847 [Cylindrobasidium torrendii FP15055 ss-10]
MTRKIQKVQINAEQLVARFFRELYEEHLTDLEDEDDECSGVFPALKTPRDVEDDNYTDKDYIDEELLPTFTPPIPQPRPRRPPPRKVARKSSAPRSPSPPHNSQSPPAPAPTPIPSHAGKKKRKRNPLPSHSPSATPHVVPFGDSHPPSLVCQEPGTSRQRVKPRNPTAKKKRRLARRITRKACRALTNGMRSAWIKHLAKAQPLQVIDFDIHDARIAAGGWRGSQ